MKEIEQLLALYPNIDRKCLEIGLIEGVKLFSYEHQDKWVVGVGNEMRQLEDVMIDIKQAFIKAQPRTTIDDNDLRKVR